MLLRKPKTTAEKYVSLLLTYHEEDRSYYRDDVLLARFAKKLNKQLFLLHCADLDHTDPKKYDKDIFEDDIASLTPRERKEAWGYIAIAKKTRKRK